MGPKIIVYDSGQKYEIDSDELYDPFPEPKESEWPREENTSYNEKIEGENHRRPYA